MTSFPRKNGTPGDEDHDTVPALATATTATGRLTVTAETVQLNAGEEAGGHWNLGICWMLSCCHLHMILYLYILDIDILLVCVMI